MATHAMQPALDGNIRTFAVAAGVDPYDKGAEAPSELVSFTSSFHGRTLGALVLTYKVDRNCNDIHNISQHKD